LIQQRSVSSSRSSVWNGSDSTPSAALIRARWSSTNELLQIRSSFVLDHLARISAAEGVESKPFQTLLRLLDTDRCWIKLASLYRLSSEPYPHRDMLPMIRKVVELRPDRVLWGSNWPHPICPVPMPNDGDLVDLIPLWLPDSRTQQLALVENPALLYGFEPTAGAHP